MQYIKTYWNIFESVKTETEAKAILAARQLDASILDEIKSLSKWINDDGKVINVLDNNEKNMAPIAILWNDKIQNPKIAIAKLFNKYIECVKKGYIKPLSYSKDSVKIDDKVFKYGDYLKMDEYLDSKKPRVMLGEKGTIDFNTKESPIWEGNNISIYDGNSIDKCIRYTGADIQPGTLTGKSYPFCIGLYLPKNRWQLYRDTKTSTFYFIVDKNRPFEDPLHMVVYDNAENGVELTDVTNNTGYVAEYGTNVEGYKKYLKSKGVPVDILLVHKPKTEQEIEDEKILANKNDSLEWFKELSIDYKIRYVGRGHGLTNEQFDWLLENRKLNNDVITNYVDTGLPITKYKFNKLLDSEKTTYLRKILMAIKKNPYYIEAYFGDTNNISKDILLSVVNTDGKLIEYINNPTEDIQLAAIKQNGNVIEYIENPTEDMQIMAMENVSFYELVQYGLNPIKFIKNPCEKALEIADIYDKLKKSKDYLSLPFYLQLNFVQQDGRYISYFRKADEDPDKRLQLAAVNKTPNSIKFIESPDKEVQLAAVNKDPSVIELFYRADYDSYLDVTPDEEVELAAVSKDGDLISYIHRPSKKIQLAAVNQNPEAIDSISRPYPEVIELAKSKGYDY